MLFVGMASLFAIGCGGSSDPSDGSIQAELSKARHEGAVAAHRQERMAELQRRVARLERRARESAPTTAAAVAPAVAEPASESGDATVLRLFHAPSGNVACAILSDGATCSVIPTNETFVLESGRTAWVEPGVAFPGEAGELARYDTTLSAGQVSCSIPAADEPRGVICTDSASGHGFEASRVESRQSTF